MNAKTSEQITAIAQRLQTAAGLIAQQPTEAGRELAYKSIVRAAADLEEISKGEKSSEKDNRKRRCKIMHKVIYNRSELCQAMGVTCAIIDELERRSNDPLPYFTLDGLYGNYEHLYPVTAVAAWAARQCGKE